MSDADALDAASESVDLGPPVKQGHSIGSYESRPFEKVDVPERPKADMSGVPPEQWAHSTKKS